MPNAEIKAHWSRVVALDCVCCEGQAEIAHAHGGSMQELGYCKTKGKKQPWMDWLVLPVCPLHHRWAPDALDVNVLRWEARWGKQVDWLDTISRALDVDVWKKMRADHPHAWVPREETTDYRRFK